MDQKQLLNGSLLGAAVALMGYGYTLVEKNLYAGILLILVGFGTIFYREYNKPPKEPKELEVEESSKEE